MSIKKVRGNGKEREDFPPEYFWLRAHHNWCDISPLSLDSPFRPVKNFSSINSSTNYASNGKKDGYIWIGWHFKFLCKIWMLQNVEIRPTKLCWSAWADTWNVSFVVNVHTKSHFYSIMHFQAGHSNFLMDRKKGGFCF